MSQIVSVALASILATRHGRLSKRRWTCPELVEGQVGANRCIDGVLNASEYSYAKF